MQLAKEEGFDKEDAKIVAAILAEMDTSDPKTSKAYMERLKEIYARNYHAIKNSKNNEEK